MIETIRLEFGEGVWVASSPDNLAFGAGESRLAAVADYLADAEARQAWEAEDMRERPEAYTGREPEFPANRRASA